MKRIFTLLLVCSVMFFLGACKKDPAVAKIFVRSQNNELVSDAKVIIIADKSENGIGLEYVDTVMTNASGYAEIVLNDYFTKSGKTSTVANFDIICKKLDMVGTGKIRCRANNLAVQTVFIFN